MRPFFVVDPCHVYPTLDPARQPRDQRHGLCVLQHDADQPLLARDLKAALPHMAHVPDGLAQCGTYFVAIEDDMIVGACGWTDGPRGAEVRKLAVHPDHLRIGIAGHLLGHVHLSAHDAGHQRIRCAASLNAVPFYAALGYTQTGWVKIDTGHAGAPFDAATMERAL